MVPSMNRVTLKRLARPLLKVGTVVLGAGMSLAIATTNAFALETIVLKVPTLGDVNVTLDELQTFAETGQASGDFGKLLDSADSLLEGFSRENVRNILNAELRVGARAASAANSAIETCPVELLLGVLSEVAYSDNPGNSAPWSTAVSTTLASASSAPVSLIDVFANIPEATMTVDGSAIITILSSVKGKVEPMVSTIGNLTVRELTSINQAKLEELFDRANIAPSDRQKIEGAIAAFGSLEPGSDIDQILSQINFGSLLQKAVSGNVAGILSEIEAINFNSVDLGPYEARISNLMIAFMDVLGVPVNKGAECNAVL